MSAATGKTARGDEVGRRWPGMDRIPTSLAGPRRAEVTVRRTEHRCRERSRIGCGCGCRGLVSGTFGGRFQDRKHQGVEVLVEGGRAILSALLGRGADAEASILQLLRNRAQAEHLDHPERTLDLGVLGEVPAGLGLEVVGPDGGGPRSEDDPALAPGADPQRRLDRNPLMSGAIARRVTTAPIRPRAATD